MHSPLQQEPIAYDFVSCLVCQGDDFHSPLLEKARFKRKIYSKYRIPHNAFFLLPFGRTNVLSQEIFDFCSLVGRYFTKHVRADEKLRASFSRAIYVGVSQYFNLAIRRLQISVTQERAVASVPFASLTAPYAVVPHIAADKKLVFTDSVFY